MQNNNETEQGQNQSNDNINDDYSMFENVIDFQEVQLNRLLTRLCERYHREEQDIIGIVMKYVELGVTRIDEIEEAVEDYMQIKAAQKKL